MTFPANGSPACKQRHPKHFWKSKCLIYMTCFGLGLKDTYRQISRRFPMRNLTNAWICPYDPAGCKCWGLLFYQYTSTLAALRRASRNTSCCRSLPFSKLIGRTLEKIFQSWSVKKRRSQRLDIQEYYHTDMPLEGLWIGVKVNSGSTKGIMSWI